eukprot:4063265-Amphidinium_carterae.1
MFSLSCLNLGEFALGIVTVLGAWGIDPVMHRGGMVKSFWPKFWGFAPPPSPSQEALRHTVSHTLDATSDSVVNFADVFCAVIGFLHEVLAYFKNTSLPENLKGVLRVNTRFDDDSAPILGMEAGWVR